MKKLYQYLFETGAINDEQYHRLDAIERGKIISLYYELRLMLYLGILLFTGGVGYIVYENISSLGHIATMGLLLIIILAGFYFIGKHSKSYSNEKVVVDKMYFDYGIVLLALLIVSLFTYVLVYFEWVAILLRWSSLLSGIVFLFMAYRYDNTIILAMGITALAASLGLGISPVNWATGNFSWDIGLYTTGILFGCILVGAGFYSSYRKIKQHFSFTYQNFGLLLVYAGALAILFDSREGIITGILVVSLTLLIARYCWKHRQFMFFLYSCICGYIALTYVFFEAGTTWEFMLFYFPFTCIGGVIFLIKKKSHFSDDE